MNSKLNLNLIKTAKNIVISREAINISLLSIEQQVIDGNADGVEVLHFAKYLEELSKKVRASAVIREDFLNLQGQGVKDYRGAKIESAETGVKYDYSQSEAWNYQKGIVDTETAILKEIETKAKKAKGVTTHIILNPNSGELLNLEVKPAIKTSTTSPKITLP